jgi:hypothetical protein
MGVPVPCFDLQLRVLPVDQGLPSRAKNLLEYWIGEQRISVFLYFFFGDAITVHFWSALTPPLSTPAPNARIGLNAFDRMC